MASEGGVDIQIGLRRDIFRGELVNYSELPSSFRLDAGVIDAIQLLRGTIYPSAQEFGALLVTNGGDRLQPLLNGKSGEGMAEMRHLTLDEDWLKRIETGQIKWITEPGNSTMPHLVFAPKALAERHAGTFTKLIDLGIQVRLDMVPRATLHTHPSGNLPSGGDISHVLYDFHGNRLIEGVVTKTETFFLIPSKQTPDLFSSEQYRFPLTFTEEMESREDDIVEHLSAQGKSPIGALNAARYEALRDSSIKYNFGLYTAPDGKTEATRIF